MTFQLIYKVGCVNKTLLQEWKD